MMLGAQVKVVRGETVCRPARRSRGFKCLQRWLDGAHDARATLS